MKKICIVLCALFALTQTLFAETNTKPVQVAAPAGCIDLATGLGAGAAGQSALHVSKLQRYLADKKYLSVEPTGYFGRLTHAAVQRFQNEYAIPTTGYVGPLTRAKLKALTCGGIIEKKIIITTPKAGDVWQRGSRRNVSWTSTLPPSFAAYTFDVTLSKVSAACTGTCPPPSAQSFKIIEATTSQSVMWAVGSDVNGVEIPDGEYTLGVCVHGDTSACATTGKIRLTSESVGLIPIVSPRAGETWPLAEHRVISWGTSSFFLPTASVMLEPHVVQPVCGPSVVCYAPLVVKPYTIAYNATNTGSFAWTVGKIDDENRTIDPGEYIVRVCEGEGSDRACGVSDIFTISQTSISQARRLEYSVSTDKLVYGPRDSILITVNVTNISSAIQGITFPNGCQASYKIGTFDYMKDRACTMVYGTLTLSPFEKKSWQFTHDLSKNPIAPGAYTLQGFVQGSGFGTTSVAILGAQ